MYLESIIGNVSINELIFDLSVLPSTSITCFNNFKVILGNCLPCGYSNSILSKSTVSLKFVGLNFTVTPDFGNLVVNVPPSSGLNSVFLIFNSSKRIVVVNNLFVWGSVKLILYSGPKEVFLKNINIASISPSKSSSGL